MSERSLWLNPCFGASGDMMLGALSGLTGGLNPIAPLSLLLADHEYAVSTGSVLRGGLGATRVQVKAEADGSHRRWSAIDAMIEGAALPGAVRDGARHTFQLLGRVEAAAHGVPIDDVHFHEVGAVDAIVDIVGSWLLLDSLDVARVVVAPVGLGHGTVQAAHGVLPLPAPATLGLLVGCPVVSLDVEAETCTPTGAALLASMATSWGSIPAGTIVESSRGAGGRDPSGYPNVLTAVVQASSAE